MKKGLAVLLSFCMIISTLVFVELPAKALSNSGSCGDNVYYTYDSFKGLVTISGNGPMTDYNSPFKYNHYINTVVIKNGVTSIGDYAFCDCNSLINITIPSSITSVGDYAFYSCALSSIKLPNTVSSIGSSVFSNCILLKNITIPYGVKSIGGWTFLHCPALESISIPSTVTNIGDFAFYDCNSLKDIYYGGNIDNWLNINIGIYNELLQYSKIRFNSYDMPIDDVHTTTESDLSEFTPDLTGANCSVSLGEMKGPSISILGHDFDLVSIKSNAEFNFGNVSIATKVDETDKTVKVILGYSDDAKANISNKTKFKDEYSQLKDLYKYINGGSNANNLAKYRKLKSDCLSKVTGNSGNIGIKAQIKITGYMEFSYASGIVNAKEAGIIVAGELGASLTYQPSIFYITTGLKGSAELSTVVAFQNNKKVSFDKIAAEFALTANVGVGIGSKALKIYAEGGLKGKINVKFTISKSVNVTSNLTGDLYVEAKAVFAEFSKTWQFFNIELLNKNFYLSNAKLNSDYFNKNSYDIPRDYSFVNTNENINTSEIKNYLSSGTNSEFTINDIYQYSAPQYVTLNNGKKVLIWVGDDGTKSDKNRTSIMYSIFSNGSWSATKKMFETGTYNDMPGVYSDGERVYLIWQRANAEFSQDEELNSTLEKINLYISTSDGESFSTPICVNDYSNTVYEDNYSIGEKDGNIYVAWHENSQNDIFNENDADNSLKYRVYSNGSWQEIKTICTNKNLIDEVAVSGDKVYYTVSATDDSETSLYCYDNSKSTLVVSAESISNLNCVNETLYFLNNNSVYTYTDGTLTDLELGELTNLRVVTNGTNVAITSLQTEGFVNEVIVSNFENGKWTEFEQFTNYDKYIRSYSPVMSEDGIITCAINAVNVDESNINTDNSSIYGSADLIITGKCNYHDTELDYFYYDDCELTPQSNLNMSYQITNNSNSTLKGFTANLYKSTGELIKSEEVSCNLSAYSSQSFNIDYTLPEALTKHDIKLIIDTNENEYSLENNSLIATIGEADISVQDLKIRTITSSLSKVCGKVVNKGLADAKNVVVNAIGSNNLNNKFGSINIATIKSESSYDFEFVIPTELLTTQSDKVMNEIYIESQTDTVEFSVANNDEKIVFDSLIKYGDANFDGNVDTKDVLAIRKSLAMWSVNVDANLCDVNHDGSVNLFDLLLIKKYLAGVITSF